MSSISKQPPKLNRLLSRARVLLRITGIYLRNFLRLHWKGTLAITAVALVFFWPLIIHISSYDVGGDASFNAWTLARDQHCILRENCPHYADGNIYFPHKNSMLYSETQLSAGLLTLPLYFINQNPLFSYNVWTILSFFFAGWFMYLLAKRLSRGSELISIMAGLVFMLAPFKMAGIFHLQNLSIFYLPLAVLLIIKYLDTALRRYLALLFATLVLLFYASWYQMIFAIIGIGIIVLGVWLGKLINWKKAALILAVVLGAAVTTLPLALQYTKFSKQNAATFKISEQVLYSSSVKDYVIPYTDSLEGRLYYHLNPGTQPNAYNLDSFSYHGFVLYTVAGGLLVSGYVWHRKRRVQKSKAAREQRQRYVYVWTFFAVAAVGFIMSLGPLVKFKGHFAYSSLANGTALVIPAPWLLVDKFLPQLQFIRAIGRASVLTLFALCCMVAYLPAYLRTSSLSKRFKYWITAAVVVLIIFELMPLHRYPLDPGAYYGYNLKVPDIYKFIKDRKDIDDIVILRSTDDYKGAPIPVVRAEDVLWAGYHNKNIYNGYSGYEPPGYMSAYYDFVDLKADDIPKMEKLGLRYVIIDKQLSAPRPTLIQTTKQLFPHKVYEDQRYVLYKIK